MHTTIYREHKKTDQLGDTDINVRVTYFGEAMHDERVKRIKLKSYHFWDFMQVMPYRLFGTTYRFHLQGSRIQEFWIFCP